MYTTDTEKLNSTKHTQKDMPFFILQLLMQCMFLFSGFICVYKFNRTHLATLLAVLCTFLLFLSNGLNAHGVSPPLKEEIKGHGATVRVDTHVGEACVELL